MTAYTDGKMQAPSAGQEEKIHAVGWARCAAAIISPIARPTQAPIVIDGMKIPAGIEEPKVTAVRIDFTEAVTRRRNIVVLALSRLQRVSASEKRRVR